MCHQRGTPSRACLPQSLRPFRVEACPSSAWQCQELLLTRWSTLMSERFWCSVKGDLAIDNMQFKPCPMGRVIRLGFCPKAGLLRAKSPEARVSAQRQLRPVLGTLAQRQCFSLQGVRCSPREACPRRPVRQRPAPASLPARTPLAREPSSGPRAAAHPRSDGRPRCTVRAPMRDARTSQGPPQIGDYPSAVHRPNSDARRPDLTGAASDRQSPLRHGGWDAPSPSGGGRGEEQAFRKVTQGSLRPVQRATQATVATDSSGSPNISDLGARAVQFKGLKDASEDASESFWLTSPHTHL